MTESPEKIGRSRERLPLVLAAIVMLAAGSPVAVGQQPANPPTAADSSDSGQSHAAADADRTEQQKLMEWQQEIMKKAAAIQAIKDPQKQKEAMEKLAAEMKANAPENIRSTMVLGDAFGRVEAIKDPRPKVTALAALVKQHPESYPKSFGTQDAKSWESYIRENSTHPHDVETFVNSDHDIFAVSHPLTASEFDYEIASFLHKSRLMPDYAERLSRQSIDEFHEDDFLGVDHRKEGAAYDKLDKRMDQSSLDYDDALFRVALSSRYSLLGTIQQELGKIDSASESFTKSIAIHPDRNAYLAESSIEEKRGNKNKAWELLSDAYLSGYVSPSSVEHMKLLYSSVYPGNTELDMERELDERYRSTFHSPVKADPYIAATESSGNVVLGELFTGADCMPCVAPDLAFDAALARYSRNQMVLLVYHNNAPHPDPLANWVTEERATYYGTGSSTPHEFLEGKGVAMAEGVSTQAQKAAEDLFPLIDAALKAPPKATLELSAVRSGTQVRVTVRGNVPDAKRTMRLRIDLVQKEVSYSGENGLRFQPMVARATAKHADEDSGFSVPSNGEINEEYTFDLAKVRAANQAYYVDFAKKEKERLGGLGLPSGIEYPEKKDAIDPTKLAVVAFIQDDGTKEIVQAAYRDATSTSATDAARD